MKNINSTERTAILAKALVVNTKKVGDMFYEDRADDYSKANRDPENSITKASNAAELAGRMLGVSVADASIILNSNIKTLDESETEYLDRITEMVIARVNQK
jgi:hypothetical protein